MNGKKSVLNVIVWIGIAVMLVLVALEVSGAVPDRVTGPIIDVLLIVVLPLALWDLYQKKRKK